MEYNEQQLREELKKRLDDLSKSEVPITKTMLWHYAIDKKIASELVDSLNDEMRRTKFARNVAQVFCEGDERTKRELMNVVRLGRFTEDDYFDRGGMPENFFYQTPPVENPSKSKRLLMTGTKAEIRTLSTLIDESKSGKRMEELLKRITPEMSEELIKSKVNYCATVGSFFESFFDQKDFLDHEVSCPRKIISTGYMRNYNMYGGETVNVRKRIEQIAQPFGIDVEFIPSFCL